MAIQLKKNNLLAIMLITSFYFACSNEHKYFDDRKIISLLTFGKESKIKYESNSNTKINSIQYNYLNNVITSKFSYTKAYGQNKVENIISYLDTFRFGHNFSFYKDGKLASYGFNTGKGRLTAFLIEFNKDGQIKQTNGTPLVYFQSSAKKSRLFFSKILFDSLSVSIRSAGGKFESLKLHKSSLQPGLLEVDLSISNMDIPLQIITYQNGIVKKYVDTIFSFKPI